MNCLKIALLLPALIASSAVAATAEDAKINNVYARLSAARAAGDVPGMTSAFEPQALLVDPRPGPVISGAELAARLGPMAERLRTDGVTIQTAYRIERRSVIGDLALDAGYMRQLMTRADGKSAARYSRFLVTLKRDVSGVWKIIGDGSMPAEQPEFDAVKKVEGLHYDG